MNALVTAKIPSLEIGTENAGISLLITQVVYSLSQSGGTTTQLTLRRPGAYVPEPVIQPNKPDHRWQELENHGKGLH